MRVYLCLFVLSDVVSILQARVSVALAIYLLHLTTDFYQSPIFLYGSLIPVHPLLICFLMTVSDNHISAIMSAPIYIFTKAEECMLFKYNS